MKKTITSLALSLPFLALAQSESFTVEGKVKNAADSAKVYLFYSTAGDIVRDSTTIEKGKFRFTGEASGPTRVNLIYNHQGAGLHTEDARGDQRAFYVDEGLTKITVKDSVKNAKIKGGDIQKAYAEYEKALSGPQKGMDGLNAIYASASAEQRKDEAFMSDLRKRFSEFSKEKEAIQAQFIKDNPDSYFSLLALQDMAGYNMDVAEVEPQFLALSEKVRSTKAAQEFAKQIESAKKTAVGQMAPDFTQNDVDGNPVSLSDFRGKYVLLDFWASWCGPCRAENPNVVAAYNKYKDKNFTVLGVSLDNPGKKDAWLEAIEKDGLEWTQVSDLQGWKNAASQKYGVRAIPQNYLIGPDGKILASNLRGEELHEKLAELLDK